MTTATSSLDHNPALGVSPSNYSPLTWTQMTAGEFQQQLQAARDKVLKEGTTEVPTGQQAQAMAKRLGRHGSAYFTFVTTPGVAPTDTLAEQAIRFVVIDRHITQGTQGEAGRRWSERIWTVMATCAQQGRSVFGYLSDATRPLRHIECTSWRASSRPE
jgi:hypothetical protein